MTNKSQSRLFEAFKSIGHITDATPPAFSFGDVRAEGLIYASIGHSFHSYSLKGLVLRDIGPQFTEPISVIYAHRASNLSRDVQLDLVFVGTGQRVLVYDQRVLVAELSGGHTRTITQLLRMGKYLISISQQDGMLSVWDSTDNQFSLVRTHKLPSDITVTSVVHPQTYLDKILFGTKQGPMYLYNVRAGKIIHKFTPHDAAITCIQTSTAVDIVAVGYVDGTIVLLDLLHDVTLFTLRHSPGPVNTISFRQDDETEPIMATGDGNGDVVIWDLERKRLLTTIEISGRPAHDESVVSVQFVPDQPVLVSVGADNRIRRYIMDRPDKPRQERVIEGHSKPPHFVEFYDPLGHYIVTTGSDLTMRCTSIDASRDHRSQQISQKQREALPSVTGMDMCYLRQGDWENVATSHQNSPVVRLWSIKDNRLGDKDIYRNPTKYGVANCIAMSHCGHFVIVGRSKGQLEKWNTQSVTLKKHIDAHDSVNACIVDNNNAIIMSAGYDGLVKFWSLSTMELLSELALSSPIQRITKSHNHSNLCAVSCDDFSVHVFDLNTKHVIRVFNGHNTRITAMCFSHDARYLVTSSADGDVMVWDIITSTMIDWIRLSEAPVTAISFHPQGLYMATCHVGKVDVCLWLNRMSFDSVVLQAVSAPTSVELPIAGEVTLDAPVAAVDTKNIRKRARELMDSDDEEEQEYKPIPIEQTSIQLRDQDEQISSMINLSGIAKQKWYSITDLDRIRSKQKEQQQADIIAPFFLPTQPGIVPQFIRGEEETSHINRSTNGTHMYSSTLLELLRDSKQLAAAKYIRQASVKDIDITIRSLSADHEMIEYTLFIDFVIHLIESKHDYDLAQAMLHLFIQVHGELISKLDDDKLFEKIQQLSDIHASTWESLDQVIQNDACMIRFFSGMY